MIKREDVFKIGRIGKPHGTKGEVVFNFDDDVFDRVDSEFLIIEIDGLLVPFFMEEYRFKNDNTALVTFCDINDMDRARELTNCDVYFPRQTDEDFSANESLAFLIGYTVVDNATHHAVGTIKGYDDSTVNLLLEVETADHRNVLIPVHDDLINHLDSDKKEIKLTLTAGLLDLE